MNNLPIIWMLTDGRAGTDGQVLGVAEKTGLPFVEKRLRFGALIGLPMIAVDMLYVLACLLATLSAASVVIFFPFLKIAVVSLMQNPDITWGVLFDPTTYAKKPYLKTIWFLAAIPTVFILLGAFAWCLRNKGIRLKRSGLVAPWPDAVISAGRRSSRAARLIRRQARHDGRHPFFAQIMRPEWSWNGYYDFDCLSIPAHDRVSANVVSDDLDAPLLLRPIIDARINGAASPGNAFSKEGSSHVDAKQQLANYVVAQLKNLGAVK